MAASGPVMTRFAETVSCFTFNADKTKMALCPSNTEIHIYAKKGDEWVVEVVLTEVRRWSCFVARVCHSAAVLRAPPWPPRGCLRCACARRAVRRTHARSSANRGFFFCTAFSCSVCRPCANAAVQHTELVTGLDWGAKTNRIVSCSQDCNAYVWTLDNGRWKPTLVILRLQRAATFVAWSPKEDKFALSSGAKLVCICYFEEEQNWWVSKHIKKHRSTVLSVAWHPNNVLVATASADNKARVFSAWTKGVDKRGAPCPVPDPEKKAETFGECLVEYECGGFVKDVAWSPSGNLLAFIAQDASIGVADVTQGQVPPTTLRLTGLPLARILFTSEANVVGAGYDCEPFLFQVSVGSVKLIKSLDVRTDKGMDPVWFLPSRSFIGGFVCCLFPGTASTNNLKMWQNMDKKGETAGVEKLPTRHQNAITWMTPGPNGQIVTGGLDGNLVWWNPK